MGSTTSSQKFMARNRAPRVQIEYDVELYGAEKKVQLPFVMGVMADLAGKPAEPQAAVADRFSPAAVARKVDSLNKLLEARTQLANLLTYMDGKTGAEEMIMKAIKDPALLQALASAPKPKDDEPQA